MNHRYPLWVSIPIVALVFMLSACTGSKEPSTAPTTEPETATPAPETAAPEAEPVTPVPSEQKPPEPSARPETKSFEMLTAEGNQSLKAVLHEGEGFSLYVFEKFAFDPAKGRLSLSVNPDYYVDIEPLPADYDLAQLEAKGKEELSGAGKVSDYSGELVEHPLGYAKLYLQASGAKGISDYMVWTSKAGDAFLFRLHSPTGEESSDFAGPVLVSLSTVERDSQP